MRVPNIYYADDVKIYDKIKGGVLVRPKGCDGLFLLWRLRLSWKVFIGDIDILVWKGGQSKL